MNRAVPAGMRLLAIELRNPRLRLDSARSAGRILAVVIAWWMAASGLNARETWLRARTDHFEVFSAASEKQTRRLIADLEQFRASFIATFGLRPAHEPRVTVLLFNSDKLFTPYKPTYKGRPKEVTGYYIGGSDEVVIALNAASDDDDYGDPAETIFHEYVHLLLHTRGLQLPAWLNEGLAELFSTFRVNGEMVEFGLPKQSYVDQLQVSSMLSLPRLMAVTEASPDYNEESRASLFYAQSWALAHFLVCSEDRTLAARLARFLATVNTAPTTADVTFREIFGQDFDGLDQKLRQYLQGGRYYQRRAPVMLKNLAAGIAIRPATDFERDFALLNLRWRVHRAGDTMLTALQLAEKFPESPRPHELLAAIAAADSDTSRALERWQQAAELGTENAFVFVQGARAKLVDAGFTADLDQRISDDDTALLRRWLDQAASRYPLYEDVLEVLALVEARATEFRVPVVNLIQSRVRQFKDPYPTLLALALIRWRAKDAATADEIVASVMNAERARAETRIAAQLLQVRFAAERGVVPDALPVRR